MHQHGLVEPKVEALFSSLEQTEQLLRTHGDKSVAATLKELQARLRRGDWTAIQSTVTEATGGMGSLRDRQLSVANGDAITREDEEAVNARLEELVRQVEQTARQAATALGIQLFR